MRFLSHSQHIRDEQKDKPRKDMLTDLQVLAKCSSSEHIVRYYGCDVVRPRVVRFLGLGCRWPQRSSPSPRVLARRPTMPS